MTWKSMRLVSMKIAQSLLYAPSAFYFYPWKPFMNAVVGDTYRVAYKHFRRDHSDSANMLMHFICLFLQLLGNFGFLNALNGSLMRSIPRLHMKHFETELIPLLTALLWIAYLLIAASDAPPIAVVLSIVCIGASWYAAPLLEAWALDIGSLILFLITIPIGALLFKNKVLKRRKSIREVAENTCNGVLKCALLLAAVGPYAVGFQGRDPVLVEHKMSGNIVLVCLITLCSTLPNPVVPVTIMGCFGSRVLYALTGQEVLRFFACGFTGMVLQGTAHGISQQQATLLNLEEEEADRKLRFEWAHCTFFPCVMWQSVYDSIVGAQTLAKGYVQPPDEAGPSKTQTG
eukprot:CAMPEP_0197856876 /NCGR_PEP_ID=MMETSP1438-20131217/29399_1 /TAXON_ID=1461541 /ORGANISM="Pterosperma sp., Strain CCMP1384" /LENGTH=344 /DNA_ID=CAMNT_0043472493 /DNA_START=311 /DNA_END=1345 /DNA_ORIENTATION=-